MPLIFVDRRKTMKNKSSPNRQKLVRRIRKHIKDSRPQNIGKGGVSGNGTAPSSPVKVASSALKEPYFRYESYGDESILIIGNDRYTRGDVIPLNQDSESNGGPGSGNGEDDFVVNIAKDEFLDLFFEDCELPDMINNKYTDKLDNKFERAGFSTSGNPAQMSVVRTYKQTLGRRKAIVGPINKQIEEVQRLLLSLDEDELPRIRELLAKLDELKKKKTVYSNFDESDMRFRRREAKPMKTADAVLIMIMDISGSMDQRMKTIARRWFALLYAFIKRKYHNTELVFIAHTDEALEMSEDDFFSTRINGGTLVSPALRLTNKIIGERYDPNETNIYVCHASDGDNWSTDNEAIFDELAGGGNLLGKIQMFTYVEISSMMGFARMTLTGESDSELWSAYMKDYGSNEKKINAVLLTDADDCYPVFKKLFRPRGSKAQQ